MGLYKTPEVKKTKCTFLKKWSKEIVIALVVAVVAAIALEWLKSWSQQRTIQNDLRAVATIEAIDNKQKIKSQGSGFFINSSGLLATNYHIIKGASDIIAKLSSGAFYKLQSYKGVDENADIAILQFDAKDTPFVKIGDSNRLYTGEQIFTIGTPIGQEGTLSKGNISNPNQHGLIQFTAPISPGNSGGGLFKINGSVVGITSSSLNIQSGSQAKEAQNINFAVPINNLKPVINGNQNLTEGSPAFYYSQGTLADNKAQYDLAITDFSEAVNLNPNYADAYIGLGGEYYEKGQYNLEVKYYEKAAELDPQNGYDEYLLATAYEDVGSYDKAISAYEKAYKLDPNDKDIVHDYALLLIAKGDKKAASGLINKLTLLDKGSGDEIKMLLERIR